MMSRIDLDQITKWTHLSTMLFTLTRIPLLSPWSTWATSRQALETIVMTLDPFHLIVSPTVSGVSWLKTKQWCAMPTRLWSAKNCISSTWNRLSTRMQKDWCDKKAWHQSKIGRLKCL